MKKNGFKVKLRPFACGVIAGVILTASTAFAQPIYESIKATFNLIKITIEDKPITAETIFYNNTTYIKARDLATALGKAVSFDQSNNTVDISDPTYVQKHSKEPLLTINGFSITLGEFDQMLNWYKYLSSIKELPKDEWENYKKFVLDEITRSYLIVTLARDYGITLTNEDHANITKEISPIIESFGGRKNFLAKLNEIGITYDIYYKLQEFAAIEKKAREDMNIAITEEDIKNFYNDNKETLYKKELRRVKHILFETADEKGNILPYAQKEQIRLRATTVDRDIKNNYISFEEAQKNHSDDKKELETNPQGYIFSKDDLLPEFAEMAFSMKADEISPIVETKLGYHIIKLMEIYEYEPYDFIHDKVTKDAKSWVFEEFITAYKASLNININNEMMENILL